MGTCLIKSYDRLSYLEEIACKDVIEKPKVSIIVPTYNNDEYLDKCLYSLLKQTLKEIEIIIIDDGSTDNTSSILNQFKADSRVVVLKQEHKKQGAARNKGIEIAKGEYIGFVDSDDWVDLDYYEKLYKSAKKFDSDIALATNVRIGGNKKTKKRLNIETEKFVTELQDKFDMTKQATNPCPTNKIYRTSLIKNNNINYPEGVYCEDKLFTVQAVYYSNGVVAVPSINYYYFRNPVSTVNNKKIQHTQKMYDDKQKAHSDVLNFLKSKNVKIRDCEFWAIKKQVYRIYTVKESLNTEKTFVFGIPIFEKTYLDYKRNEIKILGIKFKCKRRDWLENANNLNNVLNLKNFEVHYKQDTKNILFIASIFVPAGGIESRLIQYVDFLKKNDWNVFILSEDNRNENLRNLPNFYLNFDAPNFHKCLEELVDLYKINVVEFQFKNPKILKNLDLKELKRKAKVGCTIHNTGIKQFKLINQLDYKIFVSQQMYNHHYKKILNPTIIKNSVDVKENNNSVWNYKKQKRAILISRISKDKLDSIICFIKYCQKYSIDFDIAGEGQNEELIIKKLVKAHGLNRKQFIGRVDTIEFLKKNIDNYLFVGGVGLVILEAGSLGYPCFCCSEFKGNNYSFVTKNNIEFFDNFTIKPYHEINKCKQKVNRLNIKKLYEYNLSGYIQKRRNINIIGQLYLKITQKG